MVPATQPVAGACAPQSDGGRLDWSEPLPSGTWELIDVEYGADGCYGLDLGVRNVKDEIIDSTRWYLCAPLSRLGIEPGRLVTISRLAQGTSGDGGVLLGTADDDAESEQPRVELQAYRGANFPAFHGLLVASVPEFECGYVVGETCGTVTRAASVTAGGGSFPVVDLVPGDRQTLEARAEPR